ncbi:discoidin domain-containing protein [Streptomyces aculeolatus]|uniref:discoidin domain-containing protein n=1 Tax=Streptomyces aculeolatus TaxID=270689 RepID=UPI001CEDD222|nr:discoidin domain-containing protein [Streptomyces aculeolatus]
MRKHRSRHRPTVAAVATGLLLFGLPALPAVAAAGSDAAAGRPAAASSAAPRHAAAEVTDGDQDTYWQSRGTGPQWVQTDLGRQARVDEVVLKLPADAAARKQTLAVQGSADGTSFHTLSAEGARAFRPAADNTVTVGFPASLTRYVRVQFAGATADRPARLAELVVHTAAGTDRNLAAGRPLEASSHTGDQTAARAGDGDRDSFWQSRKSKRDQWLRADLGASVGIDRAVLKVPEGGSARVQNLKLQGSTDGREFTDLTAARDIAFGAAGDHSATLSFDTAVTRHVRVLFTAGTGSARLAELEVYGPAEGDTQPPGTPRDLTRTALPDGRVQLDWQPPADGSDDVSGYDVYADGVLRTGVAADTTAYVDTPAPGESVTYRVRARDGADNQSPDSNKVTAAARPAATAAAEALAAPAPGTAAATAAAADPDLAAGKPITASSTVHSFVAANANDGDRATYWEGAGGSYPNTLTVELGANADVSAVVVQLNPDAIWGPRTQTFSVLGREQDGDSFTSLKAGAQYAFDPATGNSVTVPVSGRVAALRLSFTANTGAPAGQVGELQVLGTAAPNPDLEVTGITHTPADPDETDPVALSATVHNAGEEPAAATGVGFLVGGEPAGTADVGALAPGATQTVTADTGAHDAGEYELSAVADPDDTVVEQDEGNNEYTAPTALTVSPVQSSDLVAASVTRTPSSPTGGESVRFAVALKNQGTQASASGSHPVTLTLRNSSGGTVTTLNGAHNGAIAAGATTAPVDLGTWTAANGSYTVAVEIAADANEVPVKRENNTSTESLFVGRGADMPYDMYEAEDGAVAGGAQVVGPNRTIGDVAGEASGRRAVTLDQTGESVEFTTRASTNTLVTRFSIPDAPGGGGIDATLNVYVDGTFHKAISLTSKYAWLYGAEAAPGNDPGSGPARHIYDEANLMLDETVPAGSRIRLQKDAANTSRYAIDFVSLEQVAPQANPDPASYTVPDGVTHQDVQNALDRVRMDTTGQLKGVYLPPGDYQTSSKFQVYGKSVQVVGAGPWYTRFHAPAGQQNTDVGFRAEQAAAGSAFRGFAYFGNYTSRIDGPGKVFDFQNVSDITIDDIWNEHMVCLYWGANTDDITIENSRIRNSFADAVNMTNGSTGAHVVNNESRATGDDSFALFSAIDAGGADMHSNVYENLTSLLTWRAAGIAVYGGYDNTFRNIRIADTLVYSGVTVSSLDFGYPMNGFGTEPTTLENITIERCGGHFWGAQTFPGIWLFSASKVFQGIRINNVDIIDPTYSGIMFQTNYVGGQPQFPIKDTVLTDISISGARKSGDAYDAKSGFGLWANEMPEAGQGPAVGEVTFRNLTMRDNAQDIKNTTSTFTIDIE